MFNFGTEKQNTRGNDIYGEAIKQNSQPIHHVVSNQPQCLVLIFLLVSNTLVTNIEQYFLLHLKVLPFNMMI